MRAAIYAAAKAVASAAKALNVLRARALSRRERVELYVLDYKLHRPQAASISGPGDTLASLSPWETIGVHVTCCTRVPPNCLEFQRAFLRCLRCIRT